VRKETPAKSSTAELVSKDCLESLVAVEEADQRDNVVNLEYLASEEIRARKDVLDSQD
jgi:hypothetical protein